ncbi:hypothetical protein TWF696_008557 [Orbilia brochopaga]|uniref:NmrA-like domain-containing protein n=1 Tax=Orbilia brochopaga TaxID=3140254 RepID=A0AAV9UGJ3_9PEZI
MTTPKLLTVFGATGNQGGSVIEHILAHPVLSKEYTLRGVTRSTTSDKAKALTQKGVEMVSGDLNDYDSVSKAVAGSHTVFAVTNYWENPPSKEREVSQGKRIADASKEHNIKQLIFSNLPNVAALSNGKYPNVHHFDGKAEIGAYIASLSIPHVNIIAGVFYQNLLTMLRKNPEGEGYIFAQPLPSTTGYPWFNPSRDTGAYVAGALLQPEIFRVSDPVNIAEAAGFWSGEDVVRVFKEVTGKEAAYVQLEESVFVGFLPTKELGQEMLENMFLVRDYGYYGPTVEASYKAVEDGIQRFFEPKGERPQRLEQWFRENKDKF